MHDTLNNSIRWHFLPPFLSRGFAETGDHCVAQAILEFAAISLSLFPSAIIKDTCHNIWLHLLFSYMHIS